uniref:Uncharacterized protein n=1 Tax=Ciona savignyi TaxID=51511 RepID=H2ZH82_CIOSA
MFTRSFEYGLAVILILLLIGCSGVNSSEGLKAHSSNQKNVVPLKPLQSVAMYNNYRLILEDEILEALERLNA